MTVPRLQVFYDADCGFCTRSAQVLRLLDRSRRLELAPLHEAASVTPDAPPASRLLESLHVRDEQGRWTAGGAAWLAMTDVVPVLRPIGLVARLPVIRRLVEPVYEVIARNRHRISRLLGEDVCPVDRLPR